jgi:hypothetical protein
VNLMEQPDTNKRLLKKPAKWSAYQIPSIIIIFVVLVLRFSL